MNPIDEALWRRGLEKLATAPSALTDAEREVISFYSSDTERRRLSEARVAPFATKADAPVVEASNTRRGVSPATLRKVLEIGWSRCSQEQFQQRDLRLTTLEGYANGLSAALDAKIAALEDRIVALEADLAVTREREPAP